jgi:hypothetical protein
MSERCARRLFDGVCGLVKSNGIHVPSTITPMWPGGHRFKRPKRRKPSRTEGA